jgi:hypothetical protein
VATGVFWVFFGSMECQVWSVKNEIVNWVPGSGVVATRPFSDAAVHRCVSLPGFFFCNVVVCAEPPRAGGCRRLGLHLHTGGFG